MASFARSRAAALAQQTRLLQPVAATPLFRRTATSALFSTTSTALRDTAPSADQGAGGALRQRRVPSPGTRAPDADGAISGFMNLFEGEGDNRTVTIRTCTKHGFVTTDAVTLQGPVLCIGGQVYLWDIFKDSGIIAQKLGVASPSSSSPLSIPGGSLSSTAPQTSNAAQAAAASGRCVFETMDEKTAKEIFKVFELMDPRPEIMVVGTGKAFAPLSPAVRSVIRSLGMHVDMMSTANAAATYNMLAEEGREVAAALLPLEPATSTYYDTKHQKQ
ncbi:hypothetical protein BGZ73_000760 [Actinomortierella ambigua]|nr:hypothetical protein BGZ73_000760 [Actinomortierella ambigua]